MIGRVAGALVAVVVLTQGLIGLEVHLPLPGWDFDAPVADLAAVGLILLIPALVGTVGGTPTATEAGPTGWKPVATGADPVGFQPTGLTPPAPVAWGAFLAVGLVAALLSDPEQTLQSTGSSLHAWLRKPVFCYAAYAVALPIALREVSDLRARHLLWAALGGTAALSLFTSFLRIAAGDGLWWAGIAGITNNHKTLAVWMAPFVPWLWHHRAHPAARVAGGLVAVALALSFSKTAWLAALLGLAWAAHVGGRPIVARWWAVVPALVVAFGLLSALPGLIGSKAMLDAARSRDSLDLRSWEMFAASPAFGSGPGSSVTWEMHEYPHYRTNHVDAHGVLQKVGAETGALGIVTWSVATALTGMALWRRRGATTDESWAWIGVAACLHVNLLASTEAFTMPHWVPLGLAWAHVTRDRA